MVKKGFLTLLLLAIIDSLCYSSSDHLDDLDAFKFTHSKTSTSYCGLYSIYAAAKSIGVDLHLENLVREEYLTGRNGSNTHDLINACQKNGLIAQARYGLAVDDLMLANAPMILHVKPAGGNGYYHWLLFLGFDEDGKAKIYDPPEGIGTLAKATVLAIWDGVAIDITRKNQPLFALPFCPSTLVVAMATFLGLWLFQNRCRAEWVIPLVALCLVSVLLVLPLGFLWNQDAVRHVSSSHFQSQLPKIDCKELQLMLDNDQVILVDARPAEMFQGDCIPGAINIPIGTSEINLQNALADLKKYHSNKPVVTYCQNAHCGWAERIGGLISKRTTIPVVVFVEGLNGWHSNKGE